MRIIGTWWLHGMGRFSALLDIVRGIHRTGTFPLHMASNELLCFFCCLYEHNIEQTVDLAWFERTWRSCNIIWWYWKVIWIAEHHILLKWVGLSFVLNLPITVPSGLHFALNVEDHFNKHDVPVVITYFQFTNFPCDDWENIPFVLSSSSNRKYELLSIV